MSITYLEPGGSLAFPDPLHCSDDVVAVGADLAPERVLFAYDCGIFPWFGEDDLPLWWSPDPRAVLPIDAMHVSRSLRRVVDRGRFRLTWNRCFRRVMEECSLDRPDGIWIHALMVDSYTSLHEAGHAHSLEVWIDDALVGGIYGVQRGALFAAESKFHRVTDMSKIALLALVTSLRQAGVELIDVQLMTPHLSSLGVVEWPRARYLAELARLRELEVDLKGLVPRLCQA